MPFFLFFCPNCNREIINTSKRGTCLYCLHTFDLIKNRTTNLEKFVSLKELKGRFSTKANISEYKLIKMIKETINLEKINAEINDFLDSLELNPYQRYQAINLLRREGLLIGPIINQKRE